MPYSARKIYLTCGEPELNKWANFMRSHLPEVEAALAQEDVKHEMWFSGKDGGGIFIIGVMDTDDKAQSHHASQSSTLDVDRVHREFKSHWGKSCDMVINPDHAPEFTECIFLFDAHPSAKGTML